MNIRSIACAAVLGLGAGIALAQGASAPVAVPPVTWPDDARPPEAEALRARVAGKVFRVDPRSGPGWKLDFRGGGTTYLTVDTNFRATGRWSVEPGKLCTDWYGRLPASCNTVRMSGPGLWLLRDSGEIVELVPVP